MLILIPSSSATVCASYSSDGLLCIFSRKSSIWSASLLFGCGAAALTNRIARTFPKTTVKGIDYWGAEWSYAKEQCENTRSLKVFPDMFGQKVVYGDMNQFVEELKSSGIVSEIHYIPNIERQSFVPNFVTAPWMIKNTGLIYGIK